MKHHLSSTASRSCVALILIIALGSLHYAFPHLIGLDGYFHIRYSHLLRTELFLHRWLDGLYGDHPGYQYDVVTDYDLHRDPGLLEGYKTVIINGHSEYWSAEAQAGVDRYLSVGGTVAVLSGNTMFWRTSFSEDGTVMECRKFDPRIGGRGGANIGELYHSHDHRRGSRSTAAKRIRRVRILVFPPELRAGEFQPCGADGAANGCWPPPLGTGSPRRGGLANRQ